MNYWIFPSNESEFKALEHFKKEKYVDWRQVRQSKNVKVGDIVFLYIK